MSRFGQTIYEDGTAVTKSDTARLPRAAAALYVGGTGAVAVNTLGNNLVTFAAVPAGAIIPIECTHVMSTGTTATNIVALYRTALPIGTLIETPAATFGTEILVTSGGATVTQANGQPLEMPVF